MVLAVLGAESTAAASIAYVPAGQALNVLDTAANAVVATIPLPDLASEVAVTPDGNFAYVSLATDTVAVVSTATNSVVGSISVGQAPIGLAITPDGQFVYVANSSWNSVWVIATSTNSIVAAISVGTGPISVAVTPDGASVYVANILSNNVSVINIATNTVVATISVGSGPGNLAIAPDGAFVYSSNYESGTVSVINTATNTVVSTIPTAPNSGGIAVTPDGKSVYVSAGTSLQSGGPTGTGFFVAAIDTASNTVVTTIPDTAFGVQAPVAVSPDGAFVYVRGIIVTTATNTITGTLTGGGGGTVVFAPTSGLNVSSVTFHPPAIPGGAPASGIVTLNAAAPSGGITVSLASNNPSVTVPASVTIPAGSKIVPFTAATTAVAVATPVTITATYNSSSQGGTLTLTPAANVALTSVSVNPGSVVGGVSATGSVQLSGPAGAGGVVVELWSNGTPAFVPASVTVPAGSSIATFPVTTLATSASQQDTITAFYEGATTTTTITVVPALAIISLRGPVSVVGGNSSMFGIVTLNAPAPAAGVVVSLWTSGSPVFVQSSVTVPGGATMVSFPLTTVPTTTPSQPVISAFYNGVIKTVTITVTPVTTLSLFSVTPNTVTAGGSSTGVVTLNAAAPAGGLVVALWTSGSPAFVPASVTIPAGATSATFTITTAQTSAAAQATITAFYNGATMTATLTVAPTAAVSAASVAPNTVEGGVSTTGTVTLNTAAPAGGLVVSLWTNGSPAFVPTSVTVPEGATSATFPVTTTSTSTSVQSTITAFYNGLSATANLSITP